MLIDSRGEVSMRRHIQPGLALAVLALALVAAALPGAAVAAPGALDPSFGAGGEVTTDFGRSDSAQAVAIQSDGKIVAAGGSFSFPSGDFALVRYIADGSLDPSFDSDGKVTTDFGGFDTASAVVVQSDGRIVAAGRSFSSSSGDFALARYNADGSLDTTFGNGGKVTTDLGGFDAAFGVALQADGKIVAAGQGGAGGGFALARYNADGSLDPSFGSGGEVTTHFTGGVEVAIAVAIQLDGKIVVTGQTFSGGFQQFALARYNADGSLDTTFGSGGILMTDFGLGSGFGGALVIQPDGKVVAAGRAGTDFVLARYNGDGSPDASFGSGGMVTTDFGGAAFDAAFGVALQPNGKIVAAGGTFSFPSADFALARYKADGSLDPSFGTGGKVTTDFGAFDVASAVALQADGKIIAAGQGGAGSDFALARYLGDTSAIVVSVDIKPGSSTNPINLSSHGVIPVAILTTDSFDAANVDPSTVCFGDDDNAGQRDCMEADGEGHIEDVNGDGRPDLLLHYEVSQSGIDPGDTTACVSGKTFAGVNIEGCDSITTI
jgi:uncharacterized delta-60 repeat protein